MGACSVDLPAIIVPGGPMLNGKFQGCELGSGSFNWKIKEKRKAEDFYYAGGLPVVMEELGDLLNQNCITVNGKTIGENYNKTACYNRDVIAAIDTPFQENAGIAVLKGNLCENGTVIKSSAATPSLMKHRGKAVVFESMEDYHQRIDDPELDIDENSVIVLKGVGPKGYPGMPEVGNVDLPEKLLKKGIKDLVRISDGRMSGTAYGTVVLHVSPESSIGGNLTLVKNGDFIELDVEKRTLSLDISDEEIRKRRNSWVVPEPRENRGYVRIYLDHVQQAEKGADLDILVGRSGSFVERDLH
jgi:dihydroxy-acid dehydratase